MHVVLQNIYISTDFHSIAINALLAIVQKNVAISKCSSMPEWHTVEMASRVHGDHISGIKA